MLETSLIKVPIEFLANIDGRPKPFMQTWLLLKAKNKSSHFKDIRYNYKRISQLIKVSESTLRNHIKQMVYEGYASIDNGTLRLVSVWRNPTRFKDRLYTKNHYSKITKTTINPYNLRLEVFRYKLKQQVNRQNYRAEQKDKLAGKRPTNQIKKIKSELLNSFYENGRTCNIRSKIQNDSTILDSQKEIQYDNQIAGLKLVCEALAYKVSKQEGKSISKSSQISTLKIKELTSYCSTSIRSYRRALKVNSVLQEEKDASLPLKGKKFCLKHHYRDKFGNVYKKQPLRYNVENSPIANKIKVGRTNKQKK
jgi:hypothetical protein